MKSIFLVFFIFTLNYKKYSKLNPPFFTSLPLLLFSPSTNFFASYLGKYQKREKKKQKQTTPEEMFFWKGVLGKKGEEKKEKEKKKDGEFGEKIAFGAVVCFPVVGKRKEGEKEKKREEEKGRRFQEEGRKRERYEGKEEGGGERMKV